MARRTLVKSPPELWAQCSDAASLARHLGQFGEIKITRLEPETSVAWEGEHASGTVRLEPSGWGTQVTLTADTVVEVVDAVVVEEPVAALEEPVAEVVVEEPEPAVVVAVEEPEPEPDPEPEPELGAAPRASFFARLRLMFRVPPREELIAIKDEEEVAAAPESVAVGPEPVAVAPEPVLVAEPEPVVVAEPEAEAVPEPEPTDGADPTAALVAALDSLGQAHHRPFSRG